MSTTQARRSRHACQRQATHVRRRKTAAPPRDDVDPLRLAKFRRGSKLPTRSIDDRKLKAQLQYGERLAAEATLAAARADEWLLPQEAGGIEVEGMERTYQISQVCSDPGAATMGMRYTSGLAAGLAGPPLAAISSQLPSGAGYRMLGVLPTVNTLAGAMSSGAWRPLGQQWWRQTCPL